LIPVLRRGQNHAASSPEMDSIRDAENTQLFKCLMAIVQHRSRAHGIVPQLCAVSHINPGFSFVRLDQEMGDCVRNPDVFNVMELDPGGGYKIFYLHLSTHPRTIATGSLTTSRWRRRFVGVGGWRWFQLFRRYEHDPYPGVPD
jgi:hypothetical protein